MTATTGTTAVGIIGCGKISGAYLRNLGAFAGVEVVACADLILERAREQAAAYSVPKACGVEELLADPAIQLAVNLTIPQAHAAVALAALEAGKSVYNEKPLAISREDGRRMLALAGERGLRVGCAPDTFLGGGLQTCRRLIDEGAIGVPVAAAASLLNHGPESWHPNPDFYYQEGAGPLFDMGPYYLTALIAMLGPVRRVTGSARASFPERTITSEPLAGTTITVNVPTHTAGVLDFAAGPIATFVTSFDVWGGERRLEIHGSEGSLRLPDPNTFGGPVQLLRAGEREWTDVPLEYGNTENSRGLGVIDLAAAMRSGRPARASGDLAYHVLDIMHALHDAGREGRHIDLASTCARPAPLPTGLPDGVISG
ncbi:MAG TPA: Gfo/Idh/MocA family oxidoreductase [Thermomicrobiales bacterium]|nr:Gfo/Idh/MocA family oxidoreductase [Thermomicrobiales bacterium]